MAKAKETEQRLIKSRKRVRDHGEVFTPDWLVRDMCDLVAAQCTDVGARFLEPACGDGNFLVEILRRKLDVARAEAGGRNDTARFRREAFRALTSLYGIDILPDNVSACRANLLRTWREAFGVDVFLRRRFRVYRRAASAVLRRNIVWGNSLDPAGEAGETSPIVFTVWQFTPECPSAHLSHAEKFVTYHKESMDSLLQDSGDGLALGDDLGDTPVTELYWRLGRGRAPASVPRLIPPPSPSSPASPPPVTFTTLRCFEDGMAEIRPDGSYQDLLAL